MQRSQEARWGRLRHPFALQAALPQGRASSGGQQEKAPSEGASGTLFDAGSVPRKLAFARYAPGLGGVPAQVVA